MQIKLGEKIKELRKFGYNNDRNTKLKDYVKKANRLIIDHDGDITECDLCLLDLCCVKIAANIKDYEQALAFFDSPLLSTVGNTSIPVIMYKAEFLKSSLSYLPEEVKAQIMNNPKYAGLFEK